MSGYSKATKKDEEDFKTYTAAAKKADKEEGEQAAIVGAVVNPTNDNVNAEALQDELEGKANKDGVRSGGLNLVFAEFALGDEGQRKKMLKEKYEELRAKYQWVYDQPISVKPKAKE